MVLWGHNLRILYIFTTIYAELAMQDKYLLFKGTK